MFLRQTENETNDMITNQATMAVSAMYRCHKWEARQDTEAAPQWFYVRNVLNKPSRELV